LDVVTRPFITSPPLLQRRAADLESRLADLRQLQGELRQLAARATTLDPKRCTPERVCHIIT